jgi:hypothetical protein
MDTNNNDTNQNIPLMSSDNLTNNNPNQDQQLKDLLDKYSNEANKEILPIQPEPILESGFESQIPPTVEEKPLVNEEEKSLESGFDHQIPPVNNNEMIADSIPPMETNNQEVYFSQEKNDEPIIPESEIVKPKSKMNIFKFLFFVSLFLFLAVLAMIALVFINNNNQVSNTNNSNNISTVISPTPEITSIPTSAPATASSCLVNGKQYTARETFISEDGCNTCACTSDFQVVCTEKACAATTSAITSLSKKTKFQQLITSWNSYKEISPSERNTSFKDIDSINSFWTSSVKSGDKKYDFAQKIIKGSIKKLIIDKNKLNTILGGYEYTFYITPNYEKWSNEEFTSNDFIPSTEIGDLKPLWAYSDKLVWSAFFCGGARPDVIEQQKAQDQCMSLTKETSSAFN